MPLVHLTYEVREDGDKWRARQLLNGQQLKSKVCETKAEAEARCRAWEETRGRR